VRTVQDGVQHGGKCVSCQNIETVTLLFFWLLCNKCPSVLLVTAFPRIPAGSWTNNVHTELASRMHSWPAGTCCLLCACVQLSTRVPVDIVMRVQDHQMKKGVSNVSRR
jgi:hypothetical protein